MCQPWDCSPSTAHSEHMCILPDSHPQETHSFPTCWQGLTGWSITATGMERLQERINFPAPNCYRRRNWTLVHDLSPTDLGWGNLSRYLGMKGENIRSLDFSRGHIQVHPSLPASTIIALFPRLLTALPMPKSWLLALLELSFLKLSCLNLTRQSWTKCYVTALMK